MDSSIMWIISTAIALFLWIFCDWKRMIKIIVSLILFISVLIIASHLSEREIEVLPPDPPPETYYYFGDIRWRVLDERDGKKLLLSEYLLDEKKAFHDGEGTSPSVTWANSTLRDWLNDEFYRRFSLAERTRIAVTRVENNDNPWFGTPGNIPTYDKIFLLSFEEILQYFGDSGQLHDRPPDDAFHREWWDREYTVRINDEYNIARNARMFDGNPYTWWLRSPGYNYGRVGRAMTVVYITREEDEDYGTSYLSIYGTRFRGDRYNRYGDLQLLGVRPAMWLYLE